MEAAAVTGETVALGVVMGLASTLTMDVVAGVSRRLGLANGAKGQWVGRWYLGIARGRFVHANIIDAPEQRHEGRAALIGHYVIGAVLAVFFLAWTGWVCVSPDSFLVALGYGLATSVFPWCLVFPALGFGVFGRNAPPGLKLFTTSLVNHLAYGFGLWWTAKLLPLG